MSEQTARALSMTRVAGWLTPLRVERCTFARFETSWDLVEADGTRVAIIGLRADAELLCAAMNDLLAEDTPS